MKHLSPGQVERFRARALNPQELFDMDDHLAQCEECRLQFADARQIESLKKALISDSIDDLDHPQFEPLSSYIDGTLDHSEQRSIQEHLKVCTLCRGEVEDLMEFRKTMPRTEQTQTGVLPFSKKESRRNWIRAIAAVIAIAAIAVVLWYHNRIELLEAQLKKSESQNTLLQQEVEQRSMSEAVVFRDGPAEIRIQKDGHVIASLSIPEKEQQSIRQVVEDQKFDVPPHVLKIIGTKEILMGDFDKLPFSLISPVGTAVASDRPVFRWEALTDANGYQVRVFDSEFHSVSQSPWIQQTQWTPAEALPGKSTLTWQVAARKQDEEIISPFAPFPDAKFLILTQDQIASVRKFQNRYSGFHLILGVHLAQLGLLDDAENEFLALQQSNPKSIEPIRLLKSLRSLRARRE